MNANLECRHPAVFYANGLGDTILALPALRALAALFRGRLTLICDQGPHRLLLSELGLRRTVSVPMMRNAPDWTREFDVDAVLRRAGPCDFFISQVPWLSGSLLALLRRLDPAASIGFFEEFTIPVPLRFHKHACALAFDVPSTLDGSLRFEDYSAPLRLRPRARRLATRIRRLSGGAYRTLVVHADTGANKMWRAERFVEVIDRFLDRHRDFMAFLVGSSPQPLDRGRHAARVVPCYGLPFDVSLGLVESADLFLGVDSCMLHAADFFRTPSVGLFGASSLVEFGFHVSPAAVACKARSMDDIRVEPVIDALERLAPQSPARTGAGATD